MGQNKLVRVYQRASKSIWEDDSTVLLLAEVHNVDGELNLSYNRYIYLHRGRSGNALGLSVSRAIQDEVELDVEKYIEGEDMNLMLLLYINEISGFCQRFSDEFTQAFLIEPKDYFDALERYLLSILE
ncbi:hypothetical protein [Alteromonas antoniana]|uniref:hypothetical protein n=1 Tax=Alteromonas antoniana TaxID=2803813 RepID=UPI001C48DFF0|nr:hypothetical protein [Alteromonas antoniana]